MPLTIRVHFGAVLWARGLILNDVSYKAKHILSHLVIFIQCLCAPNNFKRFLRLPIVKVRESEIANQPSLVGFQFQSLF